MKKRSFLACLIGLFFIMTIIIRIAIPETVSEEITDGPYKWSSGYDIEIDDAQCVVKITIKIELEADEGIRITDAMKNTWEEGIESKWSEKFTLAGEDTGDHCEEYKVIVDVQFVASGGHHKVKVVANSRHRENMTEWDVETDGDTAAHEAGHMLGQGDEYVDPSVPGRETPTSPDVTDSSSVMHTVTGSVQQGHYQDFADWVSAETGGSYSVN